MRCYLCPVKCGADREIRAGACGVTGITVAKAYLHPFEEPFLSPNGRSGTVFFGGCSLRCIFCQNFEVSRAEKGKKMSPKELSELFVSLKAEGAENIDLVTADHVIPSVAEALALCDLHIPVIFNSGGYVTTEALALIDPYIDIYLPDFKFSSPLLAKNFTGREDYPAVAEQAIAFMAQKSPVFSDGRLLRGLAVRHLALPAHTEDSKQVLDRLSRLIPKETPLSLMRQYTPMGETDGFPELRRRLTDREYERVVGYALSLGFSNLFTQDAESADKKFIPVW